ncbi:MAG: glycoside hydrolase family 97 protein [Cytophagales bacterium]|nr:glycoside hydrolase family 97 protein [Cytophagales bacterium]
MRNIRLLFAFLLMLNGRLFGAGNADFTMVSPDGKLKATIELKDKIYYSLALDEIQIVVPSPISMELADGIVWGKDPVARKNKARNVDETLTPLYGERRAIRDHFNELTITFKGNYALIARLYNEGFAYRFGYMKKGEIIIKDEEATFNFGGNYRIWSSLTSGNSFEHNYEAFYNTRKLSEMSDSLAYLPVLVQTDKGVNIVITESGLEDYPGFHLVNNPDERTGIKAVFPTVPTSWEPGGHMRFNLNVKERADYIAKTQGMRTFPWRILKIATEDAQLLDTDIVYKLSAPREEHIDFSWVKPGKVAWDWWSAINLLGVDFRSGINTQSYKYYIDFAAENGIEYINLDEGWSNQYDLMELDDQINLKEIIDYGHEKGVGTFLWCVHWPLDEKLDEAMDQFNELGVKGLKIDFMDRDDQVMVNYYHRIAKAAAEHQLLVNFHGAYKPSGLHRKYPNVINREGVRGLEYNKFSKPFGTTPEHAVTIPFIRMVAGPMDYTPGAMTNAQKANFAVSFERPMSQGTRCQQLAMFVVYDAPLQMLADAPTSYEAEPAILEFLGEVPTTWDETIALDGKVGDYLIMARKSGETWYVAGMTDWDERALSVDFSFLKKGKYKARIFQDGINADRIGNDYAKLEKTIDSNARQEFKLAPGGGFVIKIKPF